MNPYQRMNQFGGGRILPPVLKSLLVINIAIFILQRFILDAFSVGSNSIGDYLFAYFALWPVGGELDFFDPGQFNIWQLVSYQFMHGDIFHIGFNMFALWMFGSELEGRWGGRKFLIYYLLAGIGAGIAHLFISPIFGASGPAVGASGAVYGILLAFGMTFPNRTIFMFPFFIPIPAKYFVMIFAGIELIMGLSGSDGVAHFAHLGGAATGLILMKIGDKFGIYDKIGGFFKSSRGQSDRGRHPYNEREPANVFKMNRRVKKEPYGEERKPASYNSMSVDGEEITQSKIDSILDKISESGYQNLTEKEKRILFELSQKLK